jgi:hypothetical protein
LEEFAEPACRELQRRSLIGQKEAISRRITFSKVGITAFTSQCTQNGPLFLCCSKFWFQPWANPNIRLIDRLMMQVELILVANEQTVVTKEVVETASKNLIIGFE